MRCSSATPKHAPLLLTEGAAGHPTESKSTRAALLPTFLQSVSVSASVSVSLGAYHRLPLRCLRCLPACLSAFAPAFAPALALPSRFACAHLPVGPRRTSSATPSSRCTATKTRAAPPRCFRSTRTGPTTARSRCHRPFPGAGPPRRPWEVRVFNGACRPLAQCFPPRVV